MADCFPRVRMWLKSPVHVSDFPHFTHMEAGFGLRLSPLSAEHIALAAHPFLLGGCQTHLPKKSHSVFDFLHGSLACLTLFAQPCHIVRSCDSMCPPSLSLPGLPPPPPHNAPLQLLAEQLTQGLLVNHPPPPPTLPSSHACCCADLCLAMTNPAGVTFRNSAFTFMSHMSCR